MFGMLLLTLGILGLGILALVAFPVVLALGLVLLVLKGVLMLAFLPIRAAFWGIGGVFHLAGFFIKMVLGVVLLGIIGMFVAGLILLPLLPIAFLAGLGWLIYRFFRRPKPAPVV